MKRELARFIAGMFIIMPVVVLGDAVGWPWWGRALAGSSMVMGIRWLIAIGEDR